MIDLHVDSVGKLAVAGVPGGGPQNAIVALAAISGL